MASSTSTSDGASAGPAPRQETLTTIKAQIAAIDELIGLATQSIRVFDADLAEMGWNRPARSERLAAFLRSSRKARLEIIVHDTRWIESSCPRLVTILRTFSHAVTIHKTGAQARDASDPLLIVDGRHFLHRFHIEQPRAALGIEQPHAARPLVNRFEEIWATGEPGITATVLGL